MQYIRLLIITFSLFFSHILAASNYMISFFTISGAYSLELSPNDKISDVKIKLSEKIKLDEYQELEIFHRGSILSDESVILNLREDRFYTSVTEKKISISVEIFGDPNSIEGLSADDLKWTIKIPQRAKDAAEVVKYASDLLNFPSEYIKIINNRKKLDCKDATLSDLSPEKPIYLYLNPIDEEKKKEINRQLIPFKIIGDAELFKHFAQGGGMLLRDGSPETSFELFVTNNTTAVYISNKIYRKFGWHPYGHRTKISLLINGDNWEGENPFSCCNHLKSDPIAVVLQSLISHELEITLNRHNPNTNKEEFVKKFTYSYNGQLTEKKLRDYLADRENLSQEQMDIGYYSNRLAQGEKFLVPHPKQKIRVLVNKGDRDNYYRNKEIENMVKAFEYHLNFLYSVLADNTFQAFRQNKFEVYQSKESIERLLSTFKNLQYNDLESLQNKYNDYIYYEDHPSSYIKKI